VLLSSHWVSMSGRWLLEHSLLVTGLCFVMLTVIDYWLCGLRALLLGSRSRVDSRALLSPVMFGLQGNALASLPPRRPGEGVDLAPFGRWLMPSLRARGLTLSLLARQLGCPMAAIQSLVYGVPVGACLPSAALVDAICAHLRLDPNEGRAVFVSISSDAKPGSRRT
jgi:hypothetical protein